MKTTRTFRKLTLPVLAMLLLLCGPARAQIALQDGSDTVNWVSANTETISVTNTVQSNGALVVLLEDRGTGATAPATLSWNGVTLTNIIQEQHSATTQRGIALYYIFDPPVGTANLTATVPSAGTLALTAYTLSGVNTNLAPLVGGANTGSSGGEGLVPFSIGSVLSNSWAAVNLSTGGAGAIYTLIATTAATTNYVTAGNYNDTGNGNVQQAGYAGPLPAGTIVFTVTNPGQYSDKDNYEAAVFTPAGEFPPPVLVTSVAASPATPTLGQNVTVTANVTYYGVTPGAVTLNASGVNSADPAVALAQQSYNAGTGVAVYTNTVAVSESASGGAKILTVVAGDTVGDTATNTAVVTVSAGISPQDGGLSTEASFSSAVASETVSVTAGATALVVMFADHGATPGKGEPASVTWTVNGTNYTLTQAVETAHSQTTGRGEAIYYLYNPPLTPGTPLSITAQAGASDCQMAWFTLSGVGTTTLPLVGSANTGANASVNTLAFAIPGVPGGAFAVFNETYAATAGVTQSYTDNGVLAVYNFTQADGASTVADGYFNSLSPGTQNFNATLTSTTGSGNDQKANFEAVVFLSPIAIASASATPNPGTSGQRESLSVNVSSSAGSIASVTANASTAGGPASLALNLSGTAHVYTNSFVPVTNVFPASVSLPFTVKDSAANLIVGSLSFVLEGTNDVWNGGASPNNTWAAGGNWVGGAAPLLSSQVTFAGTTQTNVDLESSYTLSGLNFSNNAGVFAITNAVNTLTLESNSAIINLSANPETLGVPIALGGALAITAASGSVVFNQPFSEITPGTGLLTITGPGTTVWNGTNSFTGSTIINSGTLTVGPPGDMGDQGNGTGGIYPGNIANNGTLNLFETNAETLSGVISGSGPIDIAGDGTNDVLTLSGGNSFTGNLTISNTYVSDAFGNNNPDITASGIGNPQTVGQTVTINSNAVLSLDASNPLGNGSTLEQGTIIVNSGGVLQITVIGGNATVPALVLNGGTVQTVGGTGYSPQYSALELSYGLTAGGLTASPSLITNVNGGPNAVINLGVNSPAGYQSPWTVNPSGVNPSGAPDLTVAAGLINGSDTQLPTGLSLSGTGTTALSSQLNAYTGPTTINAGTLILADPGQLNGGTYAANIVNNGAFISTTTSGQTLSGIISGTGSLAATGTNAALALGASLTLAGVNTYTGPTIVGPGATLFISGAGSISDSTGITISNQATLDVSAASPAFDLAPGQNLYAGGVVNGAFDSAATSGIFPGTDGTYGTNTFDTSLTLGNGATLDYDVGTVYNGSNDLLVVTGPLTVGNNVFIHFKAPSSSASLDSSSDYVLVQATGITGNFAAAPAFVLGSVPFNGGNFSVVTDHTLNQVRLHFSATAAPLITSVSVAPPSVVRYGSVFVSVNVTPGAGTVTNVSIGLDALGGGSIGLVQQGAGSVYTNTIAIPPGAAPGTYNLTASATDTTPLSAAGNVSFVVAASREVWNGGGIAANADWDTGSNWISQLPPGYVGDSLVFAGSTGLTPVVEQNYTVQSLTFSNPAGAFAITNVNGNSLTFLPNSGVTNNSASLETLNVPVVLAGGVTLKSATASGNLVFNQPVGEFPSGSGSGVITNAGGTNYLNGTNTYSGNTVVSAGTLTIGPGGDLGDQGPGAGGFYPANLVNNGTFNFNGGVPQIFGGVISGNGPFNINGGGTNNGPIVTLTNGNSTFTGNVSLTNTYVSLTGTAGGLSSGTLGNPGSNSVVTVNNGAILSLDATAGYELFPYDSAVPDQGLVINNGGLVQITSSTTPVGPLTLNGGVLSIQTSGTTGTEPVQLSSTVTVGGTSPSLITNNPGIDSTTSGLNLGYYALVGNTTFAVANTGSGGPDLIVAAPLSNVSIDGGTSGVLKAGAGAMELVDQYNTYTGSTTITAGTLILADPGQLDAGAYAGNVGNGGTFIVSTTEGQTLSGVLSGTGNLIIETNQPVTVNQFATLTLTAVNTYTGSTVVGPGGDLVLQGSVNNTPLIDVQNGATLDVTGLAGFTVNPGQTLRGSGAILQSGTVGITNNGTLAAGESNAIGTLTLSGPLTLTAAGTTTLRLNKTGGVLTSDVVAGIGAGNATYAGTLVVTNTGTDTLALGDSFTLFGATGGTGNFSSIVGAPPGYGFTFFPNTGVLTVTSVPPTVGTVIMFGITGKTLTLSWPSTYLGSILQSNSINLNNPNDWFSVPGSTTVTNENITIGNGNVFFRLISP